MTITLRQKDLENDNKSLYLDIYENGKRKFEFLSLYLIPEINQETKERNEATLKRAQEIRAERVLHPETIPEKGHLMVVPDIPNDDSPEVIDWIQTYMEWMDGNPEYSKRTVEQTQYLQERMKEFLKAKRRPHITLMKFDKTWFKAFFLWQDLSRCLLSSLTVSQPRLQCSHSHSPLSYHGVSAVHLLQFPAGMSAAKASDAAAWPLKILRTLRC